MKIRTCFVSNSSSSSFCLIGTEIGNLAYDKLPELDFDEFYYYMIGKEDMWGDGPDLIELNKEKWEFIKKHKKFFNNCPDFSGAIYVGEVFYDDSSKTKLDLNYLSKVEEVYESTEVITGVCSQNSSYDVSVLIDNYELGDK